MEKIIILQDYKQAREQVLKDREINRFLNALTCGDLRLARTIVEKISIDRPS